MFNLFNKTKLTIDSILFDNYGWELLQSNESIKQWVNPEKTLSLSINFFKKRPDIPSLKDLKVLRFFYRDMVVESNGGLIQVDPINIQGFPAVKTILKIPQDPSGMTYLASLTFPFKSCSFVIKIQAPELGDTGTRDTFIANGFLREGKVSVIDGETQIDGWASDPYDPTFTKGTLTLARKLISEIEKGLIFHEDMKNEKPFK